MASSSSSWPGLDPPLSPSLYPTLALTLLAAGLLSSALFFVREEVGQRKPGLAAELGMAALSATALGFGTVFLLLWCGVYLG